MKGLCHRCHTSNIEVTVFIDRDPLCISCKIEVEKNYVKQDYFGDYSEKEKSI